MHNRPFTQPTASFKLTSNQNSTTSGLPCTFMGGMTAIANGCATGALSPNPVQGCVTQAMQSSTVHTAGCIKVEPTQPTPSLRK